MLKVYSLCSTFIGHYECACVPRVLCTKPKQVMDADKKPK